MLPEPLETRPNRSLTLPSLTTVGKGSSHSKAEEQQLGLYPGQGFHFWTEETHHSQPFLETQKRRKANSPGETAPSWQQLWPLLWHLRTCRQGLSEIYLSLLQARRQRLIRRSLCHQLGLEKDWAVLKTPHDLRIALNSLVQKPSLLTHPLFQTLTHSHSSLTSDTLLDMSEVPRGFRISNSFIDSVFVQTQHLPAYGIPPIKLRLTDGTSILSSCRPWTCKSTFLLGNPRIWLFMSLCWTRVAQLY